MTTRCCSRCGICLDTIDLVAEQHLTGCGALLRDSLSPEEEQDVAEWEAAQRRHGGREN